jgi:outer membrane protein assembly factor BamA
MKKFRVIFMAACCCAALSKGQRLFAQAPAPEIPVIDNSKPVATEFAYTVGSITVSGNKKTREEVILRELPFQPGDQLTPASLAHKFDNARSLLLNTSLFQEVIVAAASFHGTIVNVEIRVKERWYLFPTPYLKPVDRNLNQWLFEQKGDLDRVNYGGKLVYNNITGQNDKLRVALIYGYTHQVSVNYDRPYFDRQMKWGIKGGFAYGKNREVNYNTIDDKQVFMKDQNNYVYSFANGNIEFTYRPAIKTRHRFGISYSEESVNDSVVALNPEYFKSGRKTARFPEIYYRMSYVNLDYIPYPTRGYAAEILLGKKGMNHVMNVWQLFVKGSGNWHLTPKLFLQVNAFGGLKLPFKQPWFNQRFLGYGDAFMQGYEYYVVDGVAGGYLKTTISHKLFSFDIRTPSRPRTRIDHIPFAFYGKIYGNTGYVYNPQPGENNLSNKMLYSGGAGLDVVTFYDITFRLEWTFNQLGQNGLFLHRRTMF